MKNQSIVKLFIAIVSLLSLTNLSMAQISVNSSGNVNIGSKINFTNGTSSLNILPVSGINCLLGDPFNPMYYINASTFYSGTTYIGSDKRIKENFRNIESPLSKILKMEGWEYDLIPDSFDYVGTEEVQKEKAEIKKNRIGFVAQEIKEILPEAVHYDEKNETVGTQNICSDYDFTTGEIWTKRKFSFGKIEARIKIPKGKGLFPAFWLYGGNPVYNEIDIFEFMNNNFMKHEMTTHYDLDGDGTWASCNTDYTSTDFSLSYHIFSLVWDPNKIEWYVDGILKRVDYKHYTIAGQTTGCTIVAYRQYTMNKIYPVDPMAIILNTAIYATSELKPDNSTSFPNWMEVDWVKYYKRSSCDIINITNASQFILSNENFNFLIGNNITIDCDFTVSTGQQLKIIAKNGITLGPGFNVEAGSVFETKIDNTICN